MYISILEATETNEDVTLMHEAESLFTDLCHCLHFRCNLISQLTYNIFRQFVVTADLRSSKIGVSQGAKPS